MMFCKYRNVREKLKPLCSISVRFWLYIFLVDMNDNTLFNLFLQFLLLPLSIVDYFLLRVVLLFKNVAKDDLYVVTCIKNESLYIREFVIYYLYYVKADKIIIYDCGNDDVKLILKEFIMEGKVIYHRNRERRQMNTYNKAINRYRFCCKYISFLDIDEFLISHSDSTILSIIKSKLPIVTNRQYSTLCVKWRFFGSSGKAFYEDRPVTDRFIYRADDNSSKDFGVKGINIAHDVMCFYDQPHLPLLIKGQNTSRYIHVDLSNFESLYDNSYPSNELCLNHYFVKSKEEFVKKQIRGRSAGHSKILNSDFYARDNNEIYDNYASVAYNKAYQKYIDSKL